MSNPSLHSEAFAAPASPRRVSDRLMVLIAVGLLFFVGAVSLARLNQQIVVAPPPAGKLMQARYLEFSDGDHGRVLVHDSQTGVEVGRFESGQGSFVRGVVRSLVRARGQNRLFEPSAFYLAHYGDGRLILSDPATEESIELTAFGPTNAGVFAAMLASANEPSRSVAAEVRQP